MANRGAVVSNCDGYTEEKMRLIHSWSLPALAITMCCICTPPVRGEGRGAASDFSTLYSFDGINGSGANGPLIADSSGVLYGTTSFGGSYGLGTAFSLMPPASPGGPWTENVLWSFGALQPSPDGYQPSGGLVIGSGGVLYGTTYGGGLFFSGTVFSLTPPAQPGAAWTERLVYEFGAIGNRDGAGPGGPLVLMPEGDLLGTTFGGGGYGGGTAFSVSATGNGSLDNILWNFGGTGDGSGPTGLTADSDGVLYGTTEAGGAHDHGTAFSLAPPSPGGDWTEKVLWSFSGPPGDGDGPGPVLIGPRGVLYGVTPDGGAYFNGTAFSLIPSAQGTSWTEKVLRNFRSFAADPVGPVVLDGSGQIYGVAQEGGRHGLGFVFRLTPPSSPGGDWGVAILHDFSGTDGSKPQPLFHGPRGVLYGATFGGGSQNYGTVFSLK